MFDLEFPRTLGISLVSFLYTPPGGECFLVGLFVVSIVPGDLSFRCARADLSYALAVSVSVSVEDCFGSMMGWTRYDPNGISSPLRIQSHSQLAVTAGIPHAWARSSFS